MNYLQSVAYKALLNNKDLAHEAKRYSRKVSEFGDLLNLDSKNRALIAAELGATPEQMSGFLTITKAILNHGKCGAPILVPGVAVNDRNA